MSGPFMGVGSSTGHLRSHHVSRDSGDLFLDTPNSGEDILHPAGSGIHGVNANELQSALQGHNQHQLSRADIALILLAEIACENDEVFVRTFPFSSMSHVFPLTAQRILYFSTVSIFLLIFCARWSASRTIWSREQ